MSVNLSKLPRVGFIGFGAIGKTTFSALSGAMPEEQDPCDFVAGVLLRQSSLLPQDTTLTRDHFVTDPNALLARHPELVVECAGHQALQDHGPRVLAAGIDLLVVSSGALADAALLDTLTETAKAAGSKLYIAPGAIAGLDWLNAAALAGLTSVTYRSRKPPAAWAGTEAPVSVDKATVFYRANVREAAHRFPKNVNAAATVALASVGMDNTELELIADPDIRHNVHEVYAEGAAGKIELRLENAAEPANPKTSIITGFSLAQCIRRRSLTVIT